MTSWQYQMFLFSNFPLKEPPHAQFEEFLGRQME